MKRILLTLAALLLLASPAFGAGGATVFEFGPEGTELLLRTQVTEITTTEYCMNLTQDTTADIANAACDADLVNEIVWPHNAQVKEIKVINLTIGDPLWTCEFTLEVGGDAKATFTTEPTQTLSTMQTSAMPYNLADGDLVGIMVGQGVECGDGTADPVYIVELWGNWVADGSF